MPLGLRPRAAPRCGAAPSSPAVTGVCHTERVACPTPRMLRTHAAAQEMAPGGPARVSRSELEELFSAGAGWALQSVRPHFIELHPTCECAGCSAAEWPWDARREGGAGQGAGGGRGGKRQGQGLRVRVLGSTRGRAACPCVYVCD